MNWPFWFVVLAGIALTSILGLRWWRLRLTRPEQSIADSPIFTTSPQAILILDEQDRVVALNPAAERLLGCASSAANARPLRDWFQYDARPRPLPEAGFAVDLVFEGRGFQAQVKPAGQGQPRTWLLFLQEQTDAEQLRRSLAETTQALDLQRIYLHAALENSLCMMWMKDREGRFLAANDAFVSENHLGREADILGKTDYDLLPAQLAAFFQVSDQQVLETGLAVTFEHNQPSTGNKTWVEDVKTPILDRNGEVIGTVGRANDITARRRAEQDLRASEQRFRMMANTVPVMIWISTPDVRFTYVNPRWLDFTGGGREAELLDGWKSAVHPEDLPDLLREFEQARQSDEGFMTEFRMLRSDSVYRWMVGTVSPLHDQNGTITGFIGSCLDISEQKEREVQLLTLSLAVEQNPASVIITDRQGRIEYANPKFFEVTGYSQQEVLGQNPRILKSGETPSEEYRALWQVIQAGRAWHGLFHNRKKNGELYWERATVSGIANARGEILHFLAIKEDITAQKQAELDLQQSRASLEAIFHNPLVGIALVDLSGAYTQVNERFANMLGYSTEEMVQQTNLSITFPEDAEATRVLFRALMAREIDDFYLEKRYIRKDGEVIWGSLSATPILNPDGTIRSAVGFVYDISARKVIEEQLRHSEELHRSIIHASPDGITITDLSGTVQMVAPSVARLWGFESPEQLIGLNVIDYVMPADRENALSAIAAVIEGGGPLVLLASGKRADGSSFYFEATLELIRGDDRQARQIVYMTRDVSERIRLEEAERRRMSELEALRATMNDLSSELELPRLLNAVVERLVALLGAQVGGLALFDEETRLMTQVVSLGFEGDRSAMDSQAGEDLIDRVGQTQQTIIVGEDSPPQPRGDLAGPVTLSLIGVPLKAGERLLGAIMVGGERSVRPFDQQDAHLVELFAQQTAVAIQNAKLFSEVQRLATIDPLTGVLNRRFFFERAQKELKRSVRYGTAMAIVMLDVDHFKAINDHFGHPGGDEALRALAAVCRSTIRDFDLVGRYGGEEFILLLPETNQDSAFQVAQRLCSRAACLEAPSERGTIHLTVSIGVADLVTSGADLERMLEQADQAMYRAKQAGRNRAVAFSP